MRVMPWTVFVEGESAFHGSLRLLFSKVRESGCTLSAEEFFPLGFRVYTVGLNDGGGIQIDRSVEIAAAALGFTPAEVKSKFHAAAAEG